MEGNGKQEWMTGWCNQGWRIFRAKLTLISSRTGVGQKGGAAAISLIARREEDRPVFGDPPTFLTISSKLRRDVRRGISPIIDRILCEKRQRGAGERGNACGTTAERVNAQSGNGDNNGGKWPECGPGSLHSMDLLSEARGGEPGQHSEFSIFILGTTLISMM